MLKKMFLALQSRAIPGKLCLVFYLTALAIEVEFTDLNVFVPQHLSTTKVAMIMGMSLPFFFFRNFLGFVKANRFFLILAGLFLISGLVSITHSPLPKIPEVKVLLRYASYVGASLILVFSFWLKPRLGPFFLKTVAVMTVVSGIISILEANSAGFATALHGFLGRSQLDMIGDRIRPAATMGHPNVLGCFLSIGALLMVYLKERREIGRMVFYPSLVVLGVGIAFTGSRNSILVLAAPLLLLLFNGKTTKTALAALLIVSVCIAASPAASLYRFMELGYTLKTASWSHGERGDNDERKIEVQGVGSKSDYSFLTIRLMLWTSALRMLHDHPTLGVGPGAYNKALKSYLPRDFPEAERYKVDREWLNAHNGILNLLAEFGIAGTLLAALIFTLLFTNVLKSYRFPPPQPVHAIVLGFVAPFLFDAFFHNFFYMILFVSIVLMLSNRKCAPP